MSILETFHSKTILDQAIKQWGKNAQMIKAIEECSELNVVLAKTLNGSPCTAAQVIDEVADAMIMVNQMRTIFNPEMVDQRIAFKLGKIYDALKRTAGDKLQQLEGKPVYHTDDHAQCDIDRETLRWKRSIAVNELARVCADCHEKLLVNFRIQNQYRADGENTQS